MPSSVDFSGIQRLAPEYAKALGKSREDAKRVLLMFSGVDRLVDMNELQVSQAEAYMRSVIKLSRRKDECRSTVSI